MCIIIIIIIIICLFFIYIFIPEAHTSPKEAITMQEEEPPVLPVDQVPKHTGSVEPDFIFFLVVVAFEFISSALSLRMWQFEGEDLLQDDPNVMDFLMGVEDVFTEGALGCNQHTPPPTLPAPTHPPIHDQSRAVESYNAVPLNHTFSFSSPFGQRRSSSVLRHQP